MVNSENCFTIYPVHINSSISSGNGRKYSLENSVENPSFKEIKTGLTSLSIVFTDDENKIHPRESKEKGRFIVENKNDRKNIIKALITAIKDLRSKRDLLSDKSKAASTNFLNLKPKSKKKAKNN